MLRNYYNPYADLPEVPEDLSQEERESLMVHNVLVGCVGFILVPVVVMILVFLLGACSTARTVEVEKVRTDTVLLNQTERDSVFIEHLVHDSVFVQANGDTVIFTHWRTEYRDRWRDRVVHDSIYIFHSDTVRVEKVVEKSNPAAWWERMVKNAMIGVIMVLLAWYVLLLFRKGK